MSRSILSTILADKQKMNVVLKKKKIHYNTLNLLCILCYDFKR